MFAIPSTRATRSFRRPVCSAHKTNEYVVRNEDGVWVCTACVDEHWKNYRDGKVAGKSIGGVALPTGVKDVRRPDPRYRDVYPSRRARRAARRAVR